MEWKKLLSTRSLAERETEDQNWNKYPINQFEKDYKSIISSASFRRLQDKTQVFPLDKSDFVRTRLTHSIEVSSIAKQLGVMITKNKDERYSIKHFRENPEDGEAVQSILLCAGLLHDLGNPPFGHFGEVVIGDWFKEQFENEKFCFKGEPIGKLMNEQMKKDLCEFEGNAQALRILSKIKNTPEGSDMNLSYAVINSLIKYPTDSMHFDDSKDVDIKKHKLGYYMSEKKCFDIVCGTTGTKLSDDEVARHPLTFLMEAADDIAYATSDLEDALKKDMFTVDEFIVYFNKKIDSLENPENDKKEKTVQLLNQLEEFLHNDNRSKEQDIIVFQKWVNYVRDWLMYVVAFSFVKNYDKIMEGVYPYDMFEDGFHKYSIKILKGAMKEFVFDSSSILKLELSAKKILSSLLDDFAYAVIDWDCDIKLKDQEELSKSHKKLINIISENCKTDYRNAVKNVDNESEKLYLRFLMVTDYISGMTDSFAKNLYQELNGIV